MKIADQIRSKWQRKTHPRFEEEGIPIEIHKVSTESTHTWDRQQGGKRVGFTIEQRMSES